MGLDWRYRARVNAAGQFNCLNYSFPLIFLLEAYPCYLASHITCESCLVACLWPFLAPHPLFCGWSMGHPASMAAPLPLKLITALPHVLYLYPPTLETRQPNIKLLIAGTCHMICKYLELQCSHWPRASALDTLAS